MCSNTHGPFSLLWEMNINEIIILTNIKFINSKEKRKKEGGKIREGRRKSPKSQLPGKPTLTFW